MWFKTPNFRENCAHELSTHHGRRAAVTSLKRMRFYRWELHLSVRFWFERVGQGNKIGENTKTNREVLMPSVERCADPRQIWPKKLQRVHNLSRSMLRQKL